MIRTEIDDSGNDVTWVVCDICGLIILVPETGGDGSTFIKADPAKSTGKDVCDECLFELV